MDQALVPPSPISVSPTHDDFLPRELQLPIAPQTLKSLLVSTSTVPPKDMRRSACGWGCEIWNAEKGREGAAAVASQKE
eukprot:scaffold2083_cov73-Isochrysis_galbana.AAC.1